ncbi:pyridoxamine 5'-phosphate oxidase family protein [Halobacteriaceae archaeon SHR40]|uniref:pyridoxamine 5'-phosphate oxidase family protein n=1 Tax=Halovenus amylolytica TaxID=2500550 RepID=UPI000FE389C1
MTVEELKRYGLEEMRDEEIEQFLESQAIGVLGLPAPAQPYLLPLSYAYDGESSLYFTYVLGEESRKQQLTEQADTAPFLVYDAETMFDWRSVLLTGTFEKLPPSEWGDLADVLDTAWRPEVFTTSSTSGQTRVYEFAVTEQSGIKHTDLAPGKV